MANTALSASFVTMHACWLGENTCFIFSDGADTLLLALCNIPASCSSPDALAGKEGQQGMAASRVPDQAATRVPDQAPHLHEVHHLPGADEVAQLVREDRGALHAHRITAEIDLDQPKQQASYAAVLSPVPPNLPSIKMHHKTTAIQRAKWQLCSCAS